jgi:SAM-dependent methyltransferase
MDTGRINSIVQYHRNLITIHGSGTSGALGWTQPEGQLARFERLSCIGDLNNHSVLDAGCGYADLFIFLKDKYAAVTYYGCEQMPEVLNEAARRNKGKEKITLWVGNFLEEALPATDYILASGSLNYRQPDKEFIFKAIRTLYAQCRLGLGFNLLSGGVEPDTLLIAYDAQEITRFCYTLSAKVVLHQDYWPNDFTVFMYK